MDMDMKLTAAAISTLNQPVLMLLFNFTKRMVSPLLLFLILELELALAFKHRCS